jgi:outer membrane protein
MIQKYRKTVEFYLFLLFPALLSAALPSDSGELAAYRSLVCDYSHELKSSGYSREMYAELADRAEAEFYPSLQGGGSFQYTGNPLSLNKEIPGISQPLTFTGQHEKYGVNLSLSQPIYTGGALKGNYEKAKYEQTSAGYRIEQTLNDITYDADCRYWTAVASRELTDVARHYRESVDMLVGVVRHRVEVEFADRNDLLMALVKLNNADYLLKQAENSAEVARLSLNSLAGVPFDEHISTDSVVIPLNAADLPAGDASADMRPELKIAGLQTDIRRAEGKIAMSEYMPKFSLHVDGSYSSPDMILKRT